MPAALSPTLSSQILQPALINTNGGNRGGRSTEAKGDTTHDSLPIENQIPQRDTITLSIEKDMPASAYIPAAPYAEIWKDGRKVAEIDSRGEVSGGDGMVAAHPALGTGLAAAAQRAAIIARAIGGEIRVAGMVTDVSTLAMKARLSEAYK
ncbi:MAG: hypothetical protein NT159_13870 [Proteobacteria bacterium]|nr:hypothetical protein [Pseudomonadota bacterium]